MKIKIVLVSMMLIVNSLIAGDLGIGTDLCSRYVWRGTDVGNTPAIQPWISFSHGPVELGAWSSWSVTGVPGGNENDLYVSFSFSNFSLVLTDYFFPAYTGDDMIDDFGETGAHIVEVSGNLEVDRFSFLAGVNVMGNDTENSAYFEAGYNFYNTEEINATIVAGMGNNIYTVNGDLNAVNIGINVSKERYSVAYILNPDQKTSFLVLSIMLIK